MSDSSRMQVRIRTRNPEEAHDWLRTAYADHDVRLSGSRASFEFSHEVGEIGALMVGSCRHTMSARGSWEPLGDMLLFSNIVSGRFTARPRDSRTDLRAVPGIVFAYDPDVPMETEWHDVHMAQVRMDRGAAERLAAEVRGDDRGPARISWDLATPLVLARAWHWRSLMGYLAKGVGSNPAMLDSPLVLHNVQRTVVAAALQTFPNSAADPTATPLAAATETVRRAIAYMEEHAGEPLDVTDVALATHVGPRALQRAFRRDLDVTPMRYLRTIRLERAHADLVAGDPERASVQEIALRWGFGHPGRFAVDYRARFGRSPSDTLRG